jgi:hypothetical protein
MFLSENRENIEALGFDIADFEEWRDFEIYTNYLDSHLRFSDNRIDELFQEWGGG